MGFYDDLKLLAETPSEFGSENLIKPILLEQLEGLTDSVKCDDVSNIYGFRKGGKEGTVVLCAHHDKVMHSTILAYIVPFVQKLGSNLILSSKKHIEDLLVRPSYVDLTEGFELAEIVQDRKLKDFGEITKIPVPFASDDDSLKIFIPAGISAVTDAYEFKRYMSVYCLKELTVDDEHVKGKLDDALGISLILDVLKNTDPEDTPSILALLTNGEEDGLKGAKYCVEQHLLKEYNPDKIIVLDVTRTQKLGKGIVLYAQCGHNYEHEEFFPGVKRSFGCFTSYDSSSDSFVKTAAHTRTKSMPFVIELERFAFKNKYSILTTKAITNDSMIFGALTEIPTVALEVPIDDMHSRAEKCALSDIEMMRKFLKEYLTK